MLTNSVTKLVVSVSSTGSESLLSVPQQRNTQASLHPVTIGSLVHPSSPNTKPHPAAIHGSALPERQAGRQTGRLAGRQRGRQVDGQADREADRQIDGG